MKEDGPGGDGDERGERVVRAPVEAVVACGGAHGELTVVSPRPSACMSPATLDIGRTRLVPT